MPKISVIIPVYNSAPTLEKALLSAINQREVDKEIIVMDAGSTDGTVDIIQQYDADIDYWQSQKDDGPNDAYNQGIARATGEIISLLNADDWLEPNILSVIANQYQAEPELDVITTMALVWKMDAAGRFIQTKCFQGKNLKLNPLGSPIPNARFMRKSVLERFGTYRVRNHAGQRMIASDLEMLLRLSLQPLHTKELAQVGYHYFIHDGSLTFSNNEKNIRQMYDERVHLAEEYLQTNLAKHYVRRLKRWHRRGTLRAYQFYKKQDLKKQAADAKSRGTRISPLGWWLDYARMRVSGK